MIKKLMIEKSDRNKIKKWDAERIYKVDKTIDFLKRDREETYVLGFDIADENSKDHSVMVKFRVVDGRYIYESYEMI